jgi:hypothetical protein
VIGIRFERDAADAPRDRGDQQGARAVSAIVQRIVMPRPLSRHADGVIPRRSDASA